MKKPQCKVIMELSNGEIYDLSGYVSELSLSTLDKLDSLLLPYVAYKEPAPFSQEFELVIRGTELYRTDREDFSNFVATTTEWKCPYCGHVNQRHARWCGHMDRMTKGCNAPRPIAYAFD